MNQAISQTTRTPASPPAKMPATASPTGPEQGHQATTPKAGTTMTPATGTPPPKTET
ncbi:MAG: hypothetical protein QMC23_01715 [Rubritalea sp.]